MKVADLAVFLGLKDPLKFSVTVLLLDYFNVIQK
jgi:hypothetical protein